MQTCFYFNDKTIIITDSELMQIEIPNKIYVCNNYFETGFSELAHVIFDTETELIFIQATDFEKVKTGLTAMKSGIGAFANSAKTALQSVKGAIIATGIGALVVALGAIYLYWDDIKGAIDGVSAEQKKLNELTKANFESEKEKLTTLNSQDNTLKLQGKSEREILKIKIAQLDVITAAGIAQYESTITTQKSQKAAAERNKEILLGILDFMNIPMNVLLKTIDSVGNMLGKNFGLAKGFQDKIELLFLTADDLREVSLKTYTQAETLLLNALGMADFLPSTEKVNIKSFKDSFVANGRLDAEYYQPKYEEMMAHIATQAHEKLTALVTIKKGSM